MGWLILENDQILPLFFYLSGQNRKTCPFFDQNIVNNNDVIYGQCVDGQKFYVVKKGKKSDKISVFWPSLNAAYPEIRIFIVRTLTNKSRASILWFTWFFTVFLVPDIQDSADLGVILGSRQIQRYFWFENTCSSPPPEIHGCLSKM